MFKLWHLCYAVLNKDIEPYIIWMLLAQSDIPAAFQKRLHKVTVGRVYPQDEYRWSSIRTVDEAESIVEAKEWTAQIG